MELTSKYSREFFESLIKDLRTAYNDADDTAILSSYVQTFLVTGTLLANGTFSWGAFAPFVLKNKTAYCWVNIDHKSINLSTTFLDKIAGNSNIRNYQGYQKIGTLQSIADDFAFANYNDTTGFYNVVEFSCYGYFYNNTRYLPNNLTNMILSYSINRLQIQAGGVIPIKSKLFNLPNLLEGQMIVRTWAELATQFLSSDANLSADTMTMKLKQGASANNIVAFFGDVAGATHQLRSATLQNIIKPSSPQTVYQNLVGMDSPKSSPLIVTAKQVSVLVEVPAGAADLGLLTDGEIIIYYEVVTL